MKFILTRHLITDWNASGRIQGQIDVSLNSQGRADAERLAKELSTLGVDLIVSSDLKRAYETAEIINAILKVPLHSAQGLRECSFGRLEGLTKEQAIEQYGSSIMPHWDDQHQAYDFRPFGGEHRDRVLARHFEILQRIASENNDSMPLLVGHGRGMSTILAELGYPPELKQGEYRVVEFKNN